jgi:hypothetical protein
LEINSTANKLEDKEQNVSIAEHMHTTKIRERTHPIVVMNDVVNESSENRNKRHDLPTPAIQRKD